MRYRRLGKTSLQVSEVGFGGEWLERHPEEDSVELLKYAHSLGVNIVLDPLFGYFYKAYIFGIPQDLSATLSKIGSVTTLVNAVISTILVFVLWPALYSALSKAGKLPWHEEKKQ